MKPRVAVWSCISSAVSSIVSSVVTAGERLLDLPLVKNLTLVSGTSPVTWTHTTGYIIKDHEGVYVACSPNEAGIDGGRRVSNLVAKSEDFGDAVWGKAAVGITAPVVTVNQAACPEGPITADLVSFAASTAASQQGQLYPVTGYSRTAGDVVAGAVWMRTVTGVATVYIGCSEGAPNTGAFVACSITTAWKRYSVTRTMAATTLAYFEIGPDTREFTGQPAVQAAAQVYIWGAQIEDATGKYNQNPSEYVSKGVLAAPYHGANVDGVKWFDTTNGNTVSGNVVTEASGAALTTIKGVACDAGATNKCTNWNMRPDAALVNITKGGDAAAVLTRTLKKAEVIAAGWGNRNPEGYLDTLDNSAGVAVATATITGTTTNTSKHSINAWVMGGTGRIMLTGGVGPVTFGASSSLVNIKSENITPLATTDQLVIEVNPGQIVHFMANQMTQTAYVGRPIETAGTAVSTTVASGTLPVSGNLGLAEGAVYCEVTIVTAGNLIGGPGVVTGGSASRRIVYIHNGGKLASYDGVTLVINDPAGVLVAGNTYRAAVSYSTALSTFTLSVNGDSTSGAYNGSFSATNILEIGFGFGLYTPGAIKNLKTYPTYKTAAELNAMTAS